jgi:hypothetical protein
MSFLSKIKMIILFLSKEGMMSESESSKSEVENEIRNLGKNLEGFFKALWESEERQRVQKDISQGLSEVGESLNRTADDISKSETGKRLRADVENIQRRYESGELREKAYGELMNVLRRINSELEGASQHWKSPTKDQDE